MRFSLWRWRIHAAFTRLYSSFCFALLLLTALMGALLLSFVLLGCHGVFRFSGVLRVSAIGGL